MFGESDIKIEQSHLVAIYVNIPCRARPLWRYETIQYYQRKISHQKTFSSMPSLSMPRQLLHVQTTRKGVW